MQDIEYTEDENKKTLLVCFILWVVFPFLLLFIKRPIKDFWARLILCLFSPLMTYIVIETFV